MRGVISYRLAGFAMALAVGFVASVGLGVMLGLTVGARTVTEPGMIMQSVDRTHKGDRLNLPTDVGARENPSAPSLLMVGCEPAYSSLLKAARASGSGRCIS